MRRDARIKAEIDEIGQDWEIQKSSKKRRERVGRDRKPLRLEYLNLGFYLAAPLLLGVLVGIWLDNTFKANKIFVLIGIVLGAISAFYNLLKIIKDNE